MARRSPSTLGVDHTIFMCIENLFKEEPTHLQVEALKPTLVYILPKKKLEAAAMRNVNIQMLYRKILEESLIQSQVHAHLMRFETAPNKYKRLCEMILQVVLRAPLYLDSANYLQMTPKRCLRIRSNVLM